MKSLLAEQGVPQRVISDSGGHFSSGAFRRFSDQWCFDHVTSSPHYPQLNGHIERQVQTVKRTLKKVGFRSDVQMALLVLRATPIYSHALTLSSKITVWEKDGITRTTRPYMLPGRYPVTHQWETGRIVEKCQQPRSYL